jgi:hypothetical protein
MFPATKKKGFVTLTTGQHQQQSRIGDQIQQEVPG